MKKFVVYSSDTHVPPLSLIGGKAYGLHELQKIHNNVPIWATLSTEFFSYLLKKSSTLQSLLKHKDVNIRKALQSFSFSLQEQKLLKNLWNTISEKGKTAIAVRSSATDEDGQNHSFAGQMDSFLQITSFSQFLQAIRNCWASLYGDRAIAYRIQNNIDPWKANIAVIVQQMIAAEISGIIFTANPINSRLQEMLITSTYGLGEHLVSGKCDTDTYILNRKGTIINQELAKKSTQLRINQEKKVYIKKTADKDLQTSSLTTAHLRTLHKLALRAEQHKKVPLDIEFSIYRNTIYFLQSRPITSLKKNGHRKIWDNSNIVESYCGITTPLTFSFIRKAYFAVYHQFCKTIGIDNKTIFTNRHILENMLGLIQGRVYYNLLNWYSLVSLMPGFHYNKTFMEQMMGLQVVPEQLPQSSTSTRWNKYFLELPRLIKVGIKMLIAHWRLPKQILRFQTHFHQIYSHYAQQDYTQKTPSEILSIYRILEEKILWKWQAPITNDFEAMIFYGLLKKMTVQWIDPKGVLHNDLLSGEGNITSTDLISSLALLALEIDKDKKLKQAFLSCSPQQALLKIQNDTEFVQINKLFSSYLQKYGVRCINEMKLESVPIKENPLFCITTIQNYLRNNVSQFIKHQKKEKQLRKKAKQVLNRKLKGKRRILYNWILKHCRNAIRNRENQRFARTQAYDLVRTLVRSIGKQWEEKHILEKVNDIFYLEMDEIWSYIEGTSTCVNIKELVKIRKEEFKQYELSNPDDHIETEEEVYYNNVFTQTASETNDPIIRGLGCCSGIVEKEVKVVLSPDINLQLNQEIMVAKQTDPGWGILFPSVSGLIIEKGSMLSHSAIVAREMGIPTVIGVKNATKIFSNGDRVILDGAKGTIQIVRKKI